MSSMRALICSFLGLCLLSISPLANAQGTFQNLGFESATIVPIPGDPYGRVQFAPAFPGWTGALGGIPQGGALYNSVFLDSAAISILDQGWNSVSNNFPQTRGGLITGSFTPVLIAGLGDPMQQPADATLSQTALVPADAQSLRFRAYLDFVGVSGSFTVRLGGQTLPVAPLLTTTKYTTYGADIHQWAGQVAELAFTAVAQQPHLGDTYFYLDTIAFSNQPIPEPSVFSLTILGTLLLGWQVLNRRRSP